MHRTDWKIVPVLSLDATPTARRSCCAAEAFGLGPTSDQSTAAMCILIRSPRQSKQRRGWVGEVRIRAKPAAKMARCCGPSRGPRRDRCATVDLIDGISTDCARIGWVGVGNDPWGAGLEQTLDEEPDESRGVAGLASVGSIKWEGAATRKFGSLNTPFLPVALC